MKTEYADMRAETRIMEKEWTAATTQRPAKTRDS
jgi:hypothetical protein